MGLISANTLIFTRISWLSTVAYFLLVAPEKVYTNMFVVALGSTVSASTGSGSEGLLACLLILLAIDDLMRLTGEQVRHNFMQVLPVRLLFLFVATALCYLVKWSALATAPTFAFLFYDTVLNGWIFAAVRDELNEDSKAQIRESRGYAP